MTKRWVKVHTLPLRLRGAIYTKAWADRQRGRTDRFCYFGGRLCYFTDLEGEVYDEKQILKLEALYYELRESFRSERAFCVHFGKKIGINTGALMMYLKHFKFQNFKRNEALIKVFEEYKDEILLLIQNCKKNRL